ncbi:MAG: tryptophan synthase subunit alpha, partial [Myxococcales bacterium]|nr:tryptophan synthase subunit alpha [Myxococcales bacterium]
MERPSNAVGATGASPIARVFDELAARDEAALIPYITAGDPDLEMTSLLLRTLATAGADVIELGVPFSDPTADGPVIQRASERALRHGATLERVFEMLDGLRGANLPPIVLFGYYNPFLQYGLSRLVQRASAVGVGGLLVVDLPIEESEPLRRELQGAPIDLIQLVAPTTPEPRMGRIAELASGF